MTQVTLREYLQSIEDALTSEQVEDALSRCQYVQTQFPDALEIQRLLGETYLKQGMIQQAQQAFDWVLTNDPENVVVYCDRALISERMSDYDTALDCYQQAYELSRGNSAIRQQFNMLSSQIGQQGFMLSRAGLARLYMRGDLLSQATQEWETVLNMTPERLDARTGLLETYWREGLDDRVEKLAHQILRDIPECLKALLLLAHVTAPRDMQQARELIERAEMLDPDLVMARELFGDAIAAQPGHPFWKLVNKSPVVIESTPSVKREEQTVRDPQQVPTPALREREQVLVPDTLSHSSSSQSSSSQSSSDWNGLEGWQSIDVPTYVPQEASSNDWYSSLMHQEDVSHNAFAQEPIENRPTMEMQQQLLQDMLSAEVMQKEDEQVTASPQQNTWVSSGFSQPAQGEMQEIMSSPPEWLSMLTQDEQRIQADEPQQASAIQHPKEAANVAALDVSESVEATGVSDESEDAWRLALQTSLERDETSSDDEEESFFGPEWLKSLGAASIDNEQEVKQKEQESQPQREEALIASPVQSEIVEPVAMNSNVNDVSASDESKGESDVADPYEWIHSLAASATSSTLSEQEERNLLTTLEGLEQNLRRQGFIPLEPNTLSSIAQTQSASDEMEPIAEVELAQKPSQEQTSIQNDQPEQDALLSSVLAQLGSYVPTPQPAQQSSHSVEPSSLLEPVAEEKHVSVESSQERERTGTDAEAPLWLAQLSNVPALSSVDDVSAVSDMLTTPNDMTAVPAQQQFELPSQLSYSIPVEQIAQQNQDRQPTSQTQETPKRTIQAPAPVVSEPTFVPTPLPVPMPQSERQKLAASFNDVFSDDLEVTMRRPAVRLQPVQQTRKPQEASSVPPLSPTSMTQKPPVRREEARSASRSDGGASNQERLRRGYQHQLVGDYDEAMQEYRIIIRNAPELLGEIVSNVRALLKLAPKYSAGYRVLGDAYMRQGEYLQAMDAYNQALAITKKARV